MKALILLCILGITLISAQPGKSGSYVQQSVESAEKNPWLQTILEFGVNTFIQRAFAEGKISSQDLTDAKLIKIETQVVSGFNHKFTIEFKQPDGKLIYATMIVYTQPWTHTQELSSYSVSDAPPSSQ